MTKKSASSQTAPSQQTNHCHICGRHKSGLIAATAIRPSIIAEITKERPDFTLSSYICSEDLKHFRFKYIENIMLSEKGELTALDQEVLQSLQRHELLSSNPDDEFQKTRTRGEYLSDIIAEFGGSWKFIICFLGLIFLWVSINSLILLYQPFDPYPFILLNLILSLVAAIQAPIIMMSQNRQEAKDRAHSENDYKINLKAELEIRHLHEKLDHLISNQWIRLLDVQQVQLDLMTEILSSTDQKHSTR